VTVTDWVVKLVKHDTKATSHSLFKCHIASSLCVRGQFRLEDNQEDTQHTFSNEGEQRELRGQKLTPAILK